jgi:hypothetical protein
MSFPFAKPASMTSPNGGHRRQGDFTTDLHVLVIATTSVIVATAGGVGQVLLQTTSGSPSKSTNVAATRRRVRAH